MTRSGGAVVGVVALLCLALTTPTAIAKKAHKPHKKAVPALPAVVSRAVSFSVHNANTSKVSCASDGKDYVVRGHVTGPRAVLDGKDSKAVTLYVHGLGYGEFYWRDQAVAGYDYAAALADKGHVSVTIDRLGYGESGRPDGNQVCYGSEADYLHQIVQKLRSGRYAQDGGRPARFAKVALASHSAAGYMIEGEAISYHDVDALLLTAFSNTGISPGGLLTFTQAQSRCMTGKAPRHYTPFGDDPTFAAQHFHDVDPKVAADVLARNAPDPCGDTLSAPGSIAADIGAIGTERATPVLIVEGADDALFPPPAGQEEKSVFSGSDDVTQLTLADSGHALALGRTAPHFRDVMADWLTGHGF